MLSMSSLLMHSIHVSPGARDALKAASAAEPGERRELLHSAAKLLSAETGLECEDVRELVDLPELPCRSCGEA